MEVPSGDFPKKIHAHEWTQKEEPNTQQTHTHTHTRHFIVLLLSLFFRIIIFKVYVNKSVVLFRVCALWRKS